MCRIGYPTIRATFDATATLSNRRDADANLRPGPVRSGSKLARADATTVPLRNFVAARSRDQVSLWRWSMRSFLLSELQKRRITEVQRPLRSDTIDRYRLRFFVSRQKCDASP